MNSTGDEERPDNDGVTQQGEFGAVAKRILVLSSTLFPLKYFFPNCEISVSSARLEQADGKTYNLGKKYFAKGCGLSAREMISST